MFAGAAFEDLADFAMVRFGYRRISHKIATPPGAEAS